MKTKNILVFGIGQLGSEFMKLENEYPTYNFIPFTRKDFDLNESIDVITMSIKKKIPKIIVPNIAINTVAFNDVTACQKNPIKAYDINTFGALKLMVAIADLSKLGSYQSRYIYISTDYVFGINPGICNFREISMGMPLNMYGMSKYLAEIELQKLTPYYLKNNPVIVRTATLFGVAGCSGKKNSNFIDMCVKLLKDNKSEIKMAVDIKFSITYTLQLAKEILDIIELNNYEKIYHLTNSSKSVITPYEICKEIDRLLGTKRKIETTKGQCEIWRPQNSTLSSCNYSLKHLSNWKTALKEYLIEKGEI